MYRHATRISAGASLLSIYETDHQQSLLNLLVTQRGKQTAERTKWLLMDVDRFDEWVKICEYKVGIGKNDKL